MVAYDYSRALATATRLVARYGRPVTFVKYAEGLADETKPLEGPVSTPITATAIACFVEPSSLQSLGLSMSKDGLWKETTDIALVAADGVNDFTSFLMLIDQDETEWKIQHASELKPGSTSLLYYVGVKR